MVAVTWRLHVSLLTNILHCHILVTGLMAIRTLTQHIITITTRMLFLTGWKIWVRPMCSPARLQTLLILSRTVMRLALCVLSIHSSKWICGAMCQSLMVTMLLSTSSIQTTVTHVLRLQSTSRRNFLKSLLLTSSLPMCSVNIMASQQSTWLRLCSSSSTSTGQFILLML